MKRGLLLYPVIFNCLIVGTLQAQEHFADRYNASRVTMDDGLPHNFIDDIYRDSRGFLWISTAGGGLCRYDGYEFIRFGPGALKSNFIRNVCEDTRHRLWIVSEGGTDILDLETLHSVIPHDPRGRLAELLGRAAYGVMRDARDNIWLQCEGELHRITFNERGEVANLATLELPELTEPDLVLKDIDRDGEIWTGIAGTVCKIVPGAGDKLALRPVSDNLTLWPETYFRDMLAKENEVWIATQVGLYRYNKNSDALKLYEHRENDPRSLSQNYITSLAVTGERQLIVGTLRGANVYNPITDDFERLIHTPGGDSPLNSNFINCIRVYGNLVWFGTESGGLNRLSPKRLPIHNWRHSRENPGSLSPNPVNAIFEDSDGTLWVGTVEGGLNRREKGQESFTHYTWQRGQLGHNSVSSLAADSEGRLWVGTWGGGIDILDRQSPWHPMQRIDTTATGLPLAFIATMIEDRINRGMWIGTNRGLFFYDMAARKLVSPFAGGAAENIRNCLGAVIDRQNRLWVGADDGVYIVDLDRRSPTAEGGMFPYRHLKHKLDDPGSGLTEKISAIHESRDGTLWLGSNGYGLYRRTVGPDGREAFAAYTTARGLSNNNVRSILEDGGGNLWIGTNNGLSCYRPAEDRFVNYGERDGLPDAQFYWNAAFRSADGTLWFGTVGGLTAVDTRLPNLPVRPARVRFTRLTVGNREVLPGSKALPRDIAVSEAIRLHERDKSFSVEFSALDFEPGSTARYSYRLLGFGDEWVQVPDNRRFASYTNLRPDTYTLQVRYSPDGDQAAESVAELKIAVRPHFYKTTWFILLTIALAAGAIEWAYQRRVRSLKRQRELLHRTVEERTRQLERKKQVLEEQTGELSRQNETLTRQNEMITRQKVQLGRMAHKVQGLTQDKIDFFTSITHEFRTPVTLIAGPVERALKLSRNPQVIEQLSFVERNSKYLLSLINQLMDFRKVESGKLEVNPAAGDFAEFIHGLLAPFEVFAAERGIAVRHRLRLQNPRILYDEQALHKVIANLLSNAVKFTPDGGVISLYAAALPAKGDKPRALYICVGDSGTGIPPQDAAHIFERFYQSKKQIRFPVYGQTGTGIGLYLCQRIVAMHNGQITVRNNPTAGCSFRILLPLACEQAAGRLPSADLPTPPQPPEAAPDERAGALTVLVVEDNADMRGYIRSILREHYRVVEAAHGAEALEILNHRTVDFIVSDLMMPVMDGVELSRRVKETFAISHIPFLMLTAKTSPAARLESYRTGVDEYLLKPFDETLLLTRIENILENRRRYHRSFSSSMDVGALNIESQSADMKLIDKVMEAVKANYRDPAFEVADFSRAAGVSQSLLNKKLQSLTGQSAGQFIRSYRLNTARELILQNRETRQMNIAEIAWQVGFNDPKYFTRCFTRQFGTKPSELLNKL